MAEAALDRKSVAGPMGSQRDVATPEFVTKPATHPSLDFSIRGALRGLLADMRRDWQLYALLVPMIIWFAVFLYAPMYGLQIAFKQYSLFKGIDGSPWVGFNNFITLFSN